jgi:hypothetical protein
VKMHPSAAWYGSDTTYIIANDVLVWWDMHEETHRLLEHYVIYNYSTLRVVILPYGIPHRLPTYLNSKNQKVEWSSSRHWHTRHGN